MSKYAKQKGYKFERDIRDYLIAQGWQAKKVAGSGACRDYPGDVDALTPQGHNVLIQTKFFKNASGYGRIREYLNLFPHGYEIPGQWIVFNLADCVKLLGQGTGAPFRFPQKALVCVTANNAVKNGGENLLIVKQNRLGAIALVRPCLFEKLVTFQGRR